MAVLLLASSSRWATRARSRLMGTRSSLRFSIDCGAGAAGSGAGAGSDSAACKLSNTSCRVMRPALAAALDARRIQIVLLHQSARGGAGGGRSAGLRRGRRRFRVFVRRPGFDPADGFIAEDGVAGMFVDFLEHTVGRRRDFDHHLIGFDVHQHFVAASLSRRLFCAKKLWFRREPTPAASGRSIRLSSFFPFRFAWRIGRQL